MPKKTIVKNKQTKVSTSEVTETKVQPSEKKQISKKYLLLGIIITLLLILTYINKGLLIAATVNGKPIMRTDIVKRLEKQGGKTILDTIITQELILQEAQKRKISITQKEIDNEIKNIEKNITAQGMTLDQVLLQEGMKKSDLVNEIKIQLIVKKIVDKGITVSEKEVDDYLKSQEDQGLTQTAEETPSRDKIKEQLKQQKLQEKIQEFVADIRSKARINYFVNYQ